MSVNFALPPKHLEVEKQNLSAIQLMRKNLLDLYLKISDVSPADETVEITKPVYSSR